MIEIKISRQIDNLGRLVIPSDLRKQYGLKKGDKVYFTAYNDGILIRLEDCVCNNEDIKKN